METIGSILKTARENQNKSIDDIVETTKITRSNIVAIESDSFDFCPGHAYTKAFIKIYAEELSLNPEELAVMYEKKMSGEDDAEQGVDSSVGKGLKAFVANRKLLFVVVAGFLLLAVVLAANRGPKVPLAEKEGSSVAEDGYDDQTVDKKQQDENKKAVLKPVQNPPEASLTVGKDTVAEALIPPETALTELESEPAPAGPDEDAIQVEPVSSQTDVSGHPSEFVIRFVARDLTWIKILADEEPSEVMLRAGDSYTKSAVHSMQVRIGNSGGVSLFYNDIPLGAPGKPGEPVNILFPEAADQLKTFE